MAGTVGRRWRAGNHRSRPQKDAFEKNVQKPMAEYPELRQRYEDCMLARQRLDAAEGRGVTPEAVQAGAAGR